MLEKDENDKFIIHLQLSWAVREGPEVLPEGNAARLAFMKERVSAFAPVLRDAVRDIADGAEIYELQFLDWPQCRWPSAGGVTLMGDSAHAMTMCMYCSVASRRALTSCRSRRSLQSRDQ